MLDFLKNHRWGLLPLQEASNVAKRPSFDLLHAAYNDDITLIGAIPEGVWLGLGFLGHQDKELGVPASPRIPTHFELTREHIHSLMTSRKAEIREFETGRQYKANRPPRKLLPRASDEKLTHLQEPPANWRDDHTKVWTAWKIKPGSPKAPFILSDHEVFVAPVDLREVFSVKFVVPQQKEDWISTQLAAVLNAAEHFWGNGAIIKNEAESYPETEEIRRWFREQAQFSKDMADFATRLIKPDYVKAGRPPFKG